jgi:thymidylate kinase
MELKNQSMNNIFVTIEGVDGTGKSTVTKMLAELLGGVSIQTPSSAFSKERKVIESITDNKSEKFDFYINSLIYQQEEISELLKLSSVICDRYIHSTFAYQWADDETFPGSINGFFKNIRIPDYSFLLILNEDVRKKRITEREERTGIINNSDYRIETINIAEDRFSKMKELIKVNIDNKSPGEICQLILKSIKE